MGFGKPDERIESICNAPGSQKSVIRPVCISRQLFAVAKDVIYSHDQPVERGELSYMPPHGIVNHTLWFVKGADTNTVGAIGSHFGPELKTPFIVAVPFQKAGMV